MCRNTFGVNPLKTKTPVSKRFRVFLFLNVIISMGSSPIHDKVCSLCGQKLPLDDFAYDLHGEAGFSFYCKLCEKRIIREKKKLKKHKN